MFKNVVASGPSQAQDDKGALCSKGAPQVAGIANANRRAGARVPIVKSSTQIQVHNYCSVLKYFYPAAFPVKISQIHVQKCGCLSSFARSG